MSKENESLDELEREEKIEEKGGKISLRGADVVSPTSPLVFVFKI